MKELLEAGINVCFGHDDIFDPWYPLGTGNMLQVLHMGLHVCQLMGYEQIMHSIDMITTNSPKRFISKTNTALRLVNLRILSCYPAKDSYDAIRRQVSVRYSIRNGKIIAETKPSNPTIYLDKEEMIDFQK